MANSVQLPLPLLTAIDRKAKSLRISRDKLIIQALEREVALGTDWSPGFFDRLKPLDAETAQEFRASLSAVRGNRVSKGPLQF
jgi:hypothetical protein